MNDKRKLASMADRLEYAADHGGNKAIEAFMERSIYPGMPGFQEMRWVPARQRNPLKNMQPNKDSD